jgi:hypothetical protein
MPLPLEGISLTGFPVHVNGYFSLSQNRRCVKWPTADLVGNKTNTDKSINWNKCLVTEVLADVYFCVICLHMDCMTTTHLAKGLKVLVTYFHLSNNAEQAILSHF